MNKPRILFMGTPAFALPALDTLLAGSLPVIAAVTQPDRPVGRGQKEAAPPVKLLAQKSGVPVLQPQTVKDASFLEKFYSLKPDMVVVAAFGQILPKMIIDFPPLGCLNIHPSLLPKYRGAAPLNWSIIRGEKKTGVTIMLMDEGMDSGDILAQEETLLDDEETYGQLHDRLAKNGAALLMKTIAQVVSGKAHRRRQDPSGVTFAPRLTRETCKINWQKSAVHVVNLIRGLCPSPAAYTYLDGQLLKIYAAAAEPGPTDQPPGTIGNAVTDGLPVAVSDGHVILKDIQLAGKKRMLMVEFLRGYRLAPGSILGTITSK
jgi:methionyl-tRNA formyltransferase